MSATNEYSEFDEGVSSAMKALLEVCPEVGDTATIKRVGIVASVPSKDTFSAVCVRAALRARRWDNAASLFAGDSSTDLLQWFVLERLHVPPVIVEVLFRADFYACDEVRYMMPLSNLEAASIAQFVHKWTPLISEGFIGGDS